MSRASERLVLGRARQVKIFQRGDAFDPRQSCVRHPRAVKVQLLQGLRRREARNAGDLVAVLQRQVFQCGDAFEPCESCVRHRRAVEGQLVQGLRCREARNGVIGDVSRP